MTNVLDNVPGEQWDFEYQLEMIQQAIDTEDFDQALDLAKKGFKAAKDDPLYLDKFIKALKQIKIKSNSKIEIPENYNEDDSKNTLKSSGFKLNDIHGIGKSIADKLVEVGITCPEQLSKTSHEKLSKINGISKKSALKFISDARNLLHNVKAALKKEKDHKYISKEGTSNSYPVFQKKNNKVFGLDPYTRKDHSEEFQADKDLQKEIFKRMEEIGINESKTNDSESKEIKKKPKGAELGTSEDKKEAFHTEKFNDKKSEETLSYIEEFDEDSDTFLTSIKNYSDFFVPKKVNDLNKAQNKYSQIANEEKVSNLSEPAGRTQSNQKTLQKEPDRNNKEKNLRQLSTEKSKKKIRSILSQEAFFILEGDSSTNYDLLAVKTLNVGKEQTVVLLLPIKTDRTNENVLVSETKINLMELEPNAEMHSLFQTEIELLKETKAQIFHDIITKDSLFRFLRKYLRESFTLEYNQRYNQIFFHSGSLTYSVDISPIYISEQSVGFREKDIPFAYQRSSDLHIINLKRFPELLNFLEQKFISIMEYSQPKDIINSKAILYNKFLARVRLYSIPILLISAILVLFLPYITDILIGLSITILTSYSFVVAYLFYQYHEELNEAKEDIIGLDEIDIELMSRDLTKDEVEQFKYEYFGKDYNFKGIENRESKNALISNKPNLSINLEKSKITNSNALNKFQSSSSRKDRIIQKYSDLLED